MESPMFAVDAAGMNQKVSDRGINWYLFGQGDRLVFDAII